MELIRFDWAMKKLLRNKANYEILEGFLSELLKEDIKIQKILESESNQEYREDKYNRVDLLVENSKREIMIIEVQNNREWDFVSRLLYGTSKTIIENIDRGEDYINVKKVISVSIVYFDLGQGEDYVYKGATEFRGIHNNDELRLNDGEEKVYSKKKVEDIYPEYYIIKVNQFNELAKDSLDEWIYFLKTEKIKEGSKAKGLEKAREELDVMKLSKEEKVRYEEYWEELRYEASTLGLERKLGRIEGREEGKEEGMEKGIEKGIEKGREAGVKEAQKEIAIKMLKNNMSVVDISRITGLREEDIKDLK